MNDLMNELSNDEETIIKNRVEKLLKTINTAYNFIKSQQKEIESLKCCGNCDPDNRDCKRCIHNQESSCKTENNWIKIPNK